MRPRWLSLRPGWYLLILTVAYAVVVTGVLVRQGAELRDYREAEAEPSEGAADRRQVDEVRLWFPIPGADLPASDANLPGAPRTYRQGVSQGFDFYDGDAGIPVPYGAAVTAAAAGTLVRVDSGYRESDEDEWEALMESVAEGASADELDRLRGRQVWLETEDGRVLRYAHLSGIRDGLSRGSSVYRGQVIGYVGNSGTETGVTGSRRGARLHFEVWEGDSFFGEGMEPERVRIAAASLFGGP